MKLYVGNLSYETTEATLREAFSNYGDVVSVQIMRDRFTEQSKGFGFIEMGTDIQSERAIGGMNGKAVDGRRLRVNEATEKTPNGGGWRRQPRQDRNFGDRPFKRDGESREGRDFAPRNSHFKGRERPERGEFRPRRADDRRERNPSAEEY